MEGNSGYLAWSIKDVANKLKEIDLPEAAKKFEEEKISGQVLDMLNEEKLAVIGISELGDKLKILKFIGQMKEFQAVKVFNDPINGHTEIHPLCVQIIDTPQFQRLRYLKQGGACYFVYPGAANNRFEHSIGVCHIAGKLALSLRKRQPELNITDQDVLCVQIAGLCHDLGHGPFSHLFDNKFIPKARPDIRWKHEDGSVMMFDYLIEKWRLMKEFKKYGLRDSDIIFIKEQIAGPLKKIEEGWPYRGRDKKKGFLYEIVSNNKNGIDVDKWDYFARDCHLLGLKNTFDYQRFMKFARVLMVDGNLQICSRDKEAETLYSMFLIRATLQRRAYKHRVVNAIEFMITDAFMYADKEAIIPGKNGIPIRLSECIDDPEAYTQLNDSIFHMILMSNDDKLAESREILQRIERRQLYRCVGEIGPIKTKITESVQEMKHDIVKESHDLLLDIDLHVDLVILDYGHNTKNPFDNTMFYNKSDVNKPVSLNKSQVSIMLPDVFYEQFVRLYCKKLDENSLKVAADSFKKWRRVKFLDSDVQHLEESGGRGNLEAIDGEHQPNERDGSKKRKKQPDERDGSKKRNKETKIKSQ